jgi:hypothetical protein
MAFAVHALNIGIVVLPLAAIAGTARRVGPDSAAHQQARAGADSSALTATNGRACNRANCRSNGCTANCRLIGRLLARAPTDLNKREVTTSIIIGPETLS